MTPRSLADWLAWMDSRHPADIALGLDRVHAVRQRLALPRLADCVITVAGTNGKGTTLACLEALLRAGGHATAAYTSPHLQRYNERVCLNGTPVGDAVLCEAFARVEAARKDTPLTYFEFGTLAAFVVMAEACPDVALLEVGLGGRLDAVNSVDADMAVITRIAHDHENWLGDGLDSIAREKAGILRFGAPVFCGQRDAPPPLREQARALGAPWRQLGEHFDWTVTADGAWQWRGATEPPVALPEPGIHPDNAALALAVAVENGVVPNAPAVQAAMTDLRVPGRFERRWRHGVEVILDVAHNPDAACWLAEKLRRSPAPGRTMAVLAAMADKDLEGLVAPLVPLVDAWWVAGLSDYPRAAVPDALAAVLTDQGASSVRTADSVTQALAAASGEVRAGDRVLVFGSFFTVAEVMAGWGK